MTNLTRLKELAEKLPPGPWRYQERADAYTHIVRTPDNQFLCQMSQDTTGAEEAKARLFAALPDLLARIETLERALQDIATDCDSADHFGWSAEDCRKRCGLLARTALGAQPSPSSR